uniref:Apelin receptor A-like n=1 Tax=Petromyzon marinus TaxID=7757 RepID=A0AAJ7SPQ9_PETMA|nr:apelin receptor A-like [Petromyzon marinus]
MDIVSAVLVTAVTISIGSANSISEAYQDPELPLTSPTSSAPLSSSSPSSSSSSSFNETSTASSSSNHTSGGFPYDYNYGYDTVDTACDYSEWNVTPTLIPIVYSLVFVCGLVGNGLVVWTIARLKTRKRNTDLYIASLASADLVFVLTLPLWAAYTALGYHWPFGGFLCTLSSCVSMLNMYASIFCLTCLSLDRYVAVVCSMRCHSFRTARVTKALLAGVWTFSSLMALFTAALATTKTIAEDPADASYGGNFLDDDDDDYDASGGRVVCVVEYSSLSSNGEMSPDWWNAMAGLFHTSASFVLPEVVMIYCYACIMAKIQNHFTHVRRESGKRRRLLRTIFNLVLTFTVCWLPFHAVKVTNALVHFGVLPTRCGLERFIFVGLPYTVSLAYVNSCLNPFLYAYFDPHFRSTCLGVLRCATLEALMAAQVSSAGGSGAATASRDEPSSRSDTADAAAGNESNASDAVAALCCGRFLAPQGARAHTETETSELRKSPTRFQHESPLRGDK